MGLTKYTLGELLDRNTECNEDLKYGISNVRGVLNTKGISDTKADVGDRDLSKFLVVKPGGFIFNHRVHDKLGLGYNTSNDTFIFTNDYVAFYVKPEMLNSVLLPDYLYMWYLRPEFDRYMLFKTYGSATLFFNWDNMRELEIELPEISIQQKYVDIYKAMVTNQQCYERGLEDLKLVCDGYFDIAKKHETKLLGNYIENVDSRNADGSYSTEDVRGITNNKEFATTKADISNVDLSKFKIVLPGEFAYNGRTDGRDMLVLALNREDHPIIVTFNYNVFRIRRNKEKELLAEYVYAYCKRSEFDRRVRFNSWGSSQELLSWETLCGFKVPVPDINEQQFIASICELYIQRKTVNAKLKAQIKDICPILIKGSLEEGKE